MDKIDVLTLKIIGMVCDAREHIRDEILAEEYLQMINSYGFGLSLDEQKEIRELCSEIITPTKPDGEI